MEKNKSFNEIQAINLNENTINNKLYSNDPNYNFEKYYILNKAWYNEYKKSISKGTNFELFSMVNKLYPEIGKKTIHLKGEKKYYFPSNFILVDQNLINLISNNFGENDKTLIKKLSYDVLIFGGCIMIKSNLNPKILNVSILAENNDTKYENEIRYIFDFNNTQSMEEEIKFMKKNNFKKYLKIKNIDDNANQVEFREILNSEQKNIGIIIYIRNQKLKNSNLIHQSNISNKSKIASKKDSIFNSILYGLNHFELFTKQIKEISKSNPNYILSKKLSKFFESLSPTSQKINDEIEYEFNSSIKTGKCETIFSDLFSKLDKELNNNKNQVNKNNINQNDESLARQNFKNEHGNPSLIENFFYSIIQNKIICNKCNTIKYEYEYIKYIEIELEGKNQVIKLSDKIFETTKKFSICEKCNNNNCIREIKIDELPYILIVIIKSKENEKFNINNSFKITNMNLPGFLYSLNCIIEKRTNNFIFQKKGNWIQIDMNNNSKKKLDSLIFDVNPSVLFYKNLVDGQRFSINKSNTQMNQMNNNIPAQMNSFGNNNSNVNNNWNMNNQNNINNQMIMNNPSNMNVQMNMNMNMINNNQMNMNINNMNFQNNMGNNNINFNMMNSNNMLNQNNFNNINNQMNMNNQKNNQINNQMNMNNFNNNNMNVKTDMVLQCLKNYNPNNNNTIFGNPFKEEGNTIFITFTFEKNGKQIYLDANENNSFENTLQVLLFKYNWLQTLNNKRYFFENKEITNSKLSLKNLGIIDSSDIIIKFN